MLHWQCTQSASGSWFLIPSLEKWMILYDASIVHYMKYMRWTLSILLSQKVKCQKQLHQTMMEVCQMEIGNNWKSLLASKTGKKWERKCTIRSWLEECNGDLLSSYWYKQLNIGNRGEVKNFLYERISQSLYRYARPLKEWEPNSSSQKSSLWLVTCIQELQ